MGSYTTDADQMRGLMDAAADQATGLKLALGVELSPQQVAALTQDIIWLVEEEYMGQKVLVPHLYLASASQDDIQPTGGLYAKNVYVNARQGLNNEGTIGGATVNLASLNVTNTGGLLRGGTLNMVAQNDIQNVSGTIMGGDVNMQADGNIVSRTQTEKHGGTTQFVAQGSIAASNNLTAVAGNDITLQGSNVGSGGNTTLAAGNNVLVGAAAAYSSYGGGKISESSLTHKGSTMVTGGDLNIQAGNSLTVAGSNIATGGNAVLAAKNNVSVVAVEDTYHFNATVKSGNGGLFGSSSKSTVTVDTTTAKGSSIAAGGNLTVLAGAGNPTAGKGNVAVVGSGLAAGKNLDLAASGNVIVASAQDTAQSSYSKSSTGFLSSSSKKGGSSSVTQRGSSLLGNNVTVDAGKNVFLSASGVAAKNNTSLIARDGDVQLLSAQNQSSSWSKSQKSSFGLSFGSGEGTFSINYSKGTKRSDEAMSGTSVGSFIQAGKDVSIVAKRDVTSIGSAVLANQDVAINAGRDVNLTPGLNTTYEEHKKGTTTQGLTFTLTETKAGIFAGLTTEEKGKTITTTADQGSLIGAGRDVLIKAGEDVNIVGSSLQANRDMALDAGGSINVLEGRATEDIKAWQRNVQGGLMLEATHWPLAI